MFHQIIPVYISGSLWPHFYPKIAFITEILRSLVGKPAELISWDCSYFVLTSMLSEFSSRLSTPTIWLLDLVEWPTYSVYDPGIALKKTVTGHHYSSATYSCRGTRCTMSNVVESVSTFHKVLSLAMEMVSPVRYSTFHEIQIWHHHSQPRESQPASQMPPITWHICNLLRDCGCQNSQESGQYDPGETPFLNDCRQRQRIGSSLVMKSDHCMLQIRWRHF